MFRSLPYSASLSSTAYIRFALYVLILAGMVYHITYLNQYNPINELWSDPNRHWVQGSETLRTDPMTFTDPAGFQVYISILARLTLKNPELVVFYTFLLFIVGTWAWYRFFRELFPTKNSALLGWAVLCWLPTYGNIYGYFMQETLMLPLLGGALYATWRAMRKETVPAFVVMVILWMLAGLTRGICIPFAAVACTLIWLQQTDKMKKAIFSLVVLGIVLGPLTYRNYKMMGIFSPHGVGQMNMLYAMSGNKKIEMHYERQGAIWYFIFQSPAVESKPLLPLSDWQSSRDGSFKTQIDLDEGGRDWDKEKGRTEFGLSKYLSVTKDNLILLFFGESWPDSNRARVSGEINYQMRWIWMPLFFGVLIWSFIVWKSLGRNKLLPMLMITWLLVQGLMPIVVNEGRYRKPVEIMLVAQIIFLVSIRNRKQSPTIESKSVASK